MTLQAIKAGVIGGQLGTIYTFLLDASGEKICGVGYITKSGSITKIHIRTGSVVTSQNLKVSLQGVNSNGDPDGTILNNGQAYGIINNPSSHTFYAVSLQSATSVTVGQQISVVVEFESTAGNLNIILQEIGATLFTYADFYDGTSWLKHNYQLACLLEYSDGSYGINSFKLFYAWNHGYNKDSSPNECGNYFSCPFPTKVIGVAGRGDIDSEGTIYLYDSSDNILAYINLNPEQRRTTYSDQFILYFPEEVQLNANQYYRLTLKPTTSTTLALLLMNVDNINKWSVITPETMYMTSRTGSGSWTQDALKRLGLVPILSAFDDGSGGGGEEVIKGNPTALLGGYLNH